jgi:hypothetical protein
MTTARRRAGAGQYWAFAAVGAQPWGCSTESSGVHGKRPSDNRSFLSEQARPGNHPKGLDPLAVFAV